MTTPIDLLLKELDDDLITHKKLQECFKCILNYIQDNSDTNLETIKSLVKENPNIINLTDINGMNLLMFYFWCCAITFKKCNIELVKLLYNTEPHFSRYFDINMQKNVLMWYIRAGLLFCRIGEENFDSDICKLLINKHSISHVDRDGNTALMYYIRLVSEDRGGIKYDMIKLLANEQNVNIVNQYGDSALSLYLTNHFYDSDINIVKLLVNKNVLTHIHIYNSKIIDNYTSVKHKTDKDNKDYLYELFDLLRATNCYNMTTMWGL